MINYDEKKHSMMGHNLPPLSREDFIE
jgi:hypothetical protein